MYLRNHHQYAIENLNYRKLIWYGLASYVCLLQWHSWLSKKCNYVSSDFFVFLEKITKNGKVMKFFSGLCRDDVTTSIDDVISKNESHCHSHVREKIFEKIRRRNFRNLLCSEIMQQKKPEVLIFTPGSGRVNPQTTKVFRQPKTPERGGCNPLNFCLSVFWDSQHRINSTRKQEWSCITCTNHDEQGVTISNFDPNFQGHPLKSNKEFQ